MVSKTLVDKVFDKGSKVRGKSPETWRKDPKGNTIRKGSYGTNGDFGWEIDHKKPQSKGGSDDLRNLQPLKTSANRKKGDKYPLSNQGNEKPDHCWTGFTFPLVCNFLRPHKRDHSTDRDHQNAHHASAKAGSG